MVGNKDGGRRAAVILLVYAEGVALHDVGGVREKLFACFKLGEGLLQGSARALNAAVAYAFVRNAYDSGVAMVFYVMLAVGSCAF
jgi:hypothetical protein